MEHQPETNSSVQEAAEEQQERSSVFRRKSIDRISSPEQLNDYIRVASPRMWAVLLAVLAFLAGALVWAAFGRISSNVYGVAIVEEGRCTVYFAREKAELVQAGDTAEVNKEQLPLASVSAEPFALDESFPAYARSVGGFSLGEWICSAEAGSTSLPDGIYRASVTEESLSPISFLTDKD